MPYVLIFHFIQLKELEVRQGSGFFIVALSSGIRVNVRTDPAPGRKIFYDPLAVVAVSDVRGFRLTFFVRRIDENILTRC